MSGDNLRFLQESFQARQGVMAAYREFIRRTEGVADPEAREAVRLR